MITSVSCGSHAQKLRSDEEDEEQECDSGLFLTDLLPTFGSQNDLTCSEAALSALDSARQEPQKHKLEVCTDKGEGSFSYGAPKMYLSQYFNMCQVRSLSEDSHAR